MKKIMRTRKYIGALTVVGLMMTLALCCSEAGMAKEFVAISTMRTVHETPDLATVLGAPNDSETHTVTVYYYSSATNGELCEPTRMTLRSGEGYTVVSPRVRNHTTRCETVSGSVEDCDVTHTVKYSEIN